MESSAGATDAVAGWSRPRAPADWSVAHVHSRSQVEGVVVGPDELGGRDRRLRDPTEVIVEGHRVGEAR
jgi:hypothetical protein